MILNDDKITSTTTSGIIIDKILVFDGTPQSPGISFFNDPSSGLYRISQGVLGISIGGNRVGQIDVNGIQTSQPYWNIVDQKPNGTSGGTFTSGAWQTRTLNTTIGTNTITGSSLLSNQFILPSGTYRINASAPAYACDRHKIKLRNITDSSDTLIGTSESLNASTFPSNRSFLIGNFTISSQKTFEIQHRCNTTSNTFGFGVESNFGVPEIYTQVELWKIG
jgi:hypothetical protein